MRSPPEWSITFPVPFLLIFLDLVGVIAIASIRMIHIGFEGGQFISLILIDDALCWSPS